MDDDQRRPGGLDKIYSTIKEAVYDAFDRNAGEWNVVWRELHADYIDPNFLINNRLDNQIVNQIIAGFEKDLRCQI
jgi:hypothetical protein